MLLVSLLTTRVPWEEAIAKKEDVSVVGLTQCHARCWRDTGDQPSVPCEAIDRSVHADNNDDNDGNDDNDERNGNDNKSERRGWVWDGRGWRGERATTWLGRGAKASCSLTGTKNRV